MQTASFHLLLDANKTSVHKKHVTPAEFLVYQHQHVGKVGGHVVANIAKGEEGAWAIDGDKRVVLEKDKDGNPTKTADITPEQEKRLIIKKHGQRVFDAVFPYGKIPATFKEIGILEDGTNPLAEVKKAAEPEQEPLEITIAPLNG